MRDAAEQYARAQVNTARGGYRPDEVTKMLIDAYLEGVQQERSEAREMMRRR